MTKLRKMTSKRKEKIEVMSVEEFRGQSLDVKAALLDSLIPLGLMCLQEELERAVEALSGIRYSRKKDNKLCRYGSNRSSVRIGGQKVPVDVPRVRDMRDKKEVPLDMMNALRKQQGCVNEEVLKRVLLGVSCRNYEEVSGLVPEALGVSPSSVSRQFKMASTKQLREFQEQSLEDMDIVALILDGKTFADDTMIIALGIMMDGKKVPLGFVQTETENKIVVKHFLEGLLMRGLSIDHGILVVVDGAKGLISGVKAAFKGQHLIQRCQWHKRENVLSYLSKSDQTYWRKRLTIAYKKPDYDAAKAALMAIYHDLEDINLDAAASLKEGLEETLTLHRLKLFPLLGPSLKTTNCLESINGQIESLCGRICHWKNSSQKKRWLAAALLHIKDNLYRIKGFKHLPRLREALIEHLNLPLLKQEAA